MIDYEDNENDESSSEKYIDPNDLIMIEDNHSWKPTENFILGYAAQLGFDIENDPPELLSIAEKYLTKQIPDIYQRAFAKGSYRLVYINRITNEIKLKSDLEDDAVEEYKELKEKYLREQKEKQKLANKVKVLPRKKIAPIGGKKILENPIKEREKEFLKQIEIQYKEDEKAKENQDEEIRQLNEKIERDKIKEKMLFGNDEDYEENLEDNINENKYNNNNYDQNHEINSKEKKFPNKNKYKNNDNMNSKNNYNTNDNNIPMLNLNDSNDNNGREYKNIAINKMKNQQKFQDDSFSDKEQNNNGIFIDNNYTISDKDKNKNDENDDYNYISNKNKYNNKNDDEDKYNNLNNKRDEEMDNSSDNEKVPKIFRNNKRRKSLDKDYKFDKETIDKIDNENDNSNIFNDNNKSNEHIKEKINDYKNINQDNNRDNEINIDINDNNYLNKLEKNTYLDMIKKEFDEEKKKYKENYKRDKNNFIKEFNDNYLSKKDNDLKRYKNELKEDLSNYENELKNKMNEDIEKYKKELIEEQENDLAYSYDDNNGDFDINNLELKRNNLEDQIKEQKKSNYEKKKNDEKLERNNENEAKKHLEEMNKIKKARLDIQLNNKIKEYSDQIQKDFENYQQNYNINNNIFTGNNINNSKEDLMNAKLTEYSNDLKSQLEENKKFMEEEYEIKHRKEMEEFQNSLNLEKTKSPKRLDENKKDIENDYYSDLYKIKTNMKKSNEKLEEIINDIINKASSSFAIIKNKEIKDIDLIMQEITQKIKQIINGKENKDSTSLIEDYLSELITEKKIFLSKYNSLVNMNEDDFKNKKFLLQFYTEIVKLIIQVLTVNKNNINDSALAEEIISNVNDIINNFKIKYESEKSNKLYPLLYKAFQKIMNSVFNDDETNNIIDISICGQALLNSTNINATYLNNNSILNDSNINNNLLKSNKAIQNQNIINNSNMNLNPSINDQFFNKSINIKSSPDKKGEPKANQILNQSQTFTYRQNNNVNNISSSFSPNRITNSLNKTFSNSAKVNNNLKRIQPINEQTELDVNNNNINVPQLPNEIINNISLECRNKYDIIVNFLIEESKNILEDLNKYNKQKEENNKVNILKESVGLSQYNKIFDLISKEENSKANQLLNNINYKSRAFESIKNYCEDIFKFIIKYSTKTKHINNKLSQVIKYIEEYNRNYYGGKNNNYNYDDNMSVFYKNQIENALNNTFNLDINNNRFYNNINISLLNTMQRSNNNDNMHNLSYMNKF